MKKKHLVDIAEFLRTHEMAYSALEIAKKVHIDWQQVIDCVDVLNELGLINVAEKDDVRYYMHGVWHADRMIENFREM